ncbi:MAG: SDR family oxidoreductase [Eubacteriales bacterium]|nr:SDR family oxidoreductase [Eubacteriales bacterium]
MARQIDFETVLITGASSGIGAALARELASPFRHLILVARNEQRLHHLANDLKDKQRCQTTIIAIDLARPGNSKALFDKIVRQGHEVDLLINNAGAGSSGLILEQTAIEQTDMIELNIKALTDLSRLFASDMVKRGKGLILNVASTGAYQPGPYTAVYYATKSYVHSFSLAMDYELRGTGVSVSLLCPGATATAFSQRAGKADVKQAMTPQVVARLTCKALFKQKKLIIPGFSNRLVIILSKLLPGSWLAAAVAKIQKPLILP